MADRTHRTALNASQQNDLNCACFEAAAAGNLSAVRNSLLKGADFFWGYSSRWSDKLLHMAVHSGNHNLVRWVVDEYRRRARAALFGELDAYIRFVDASGESGTPLHMAIVRSDLKMAELLLSLGANPLAVSSTGTSALHVAAEGGHKPALVLLVSELQRRGIQFGVPPQGAFEVVDDIGDTPLHVASRHGQARSIRILVDAGADVNATNRDDFTPLALAAAINSIRSVQILLSAGANPEVGEAPVAMAAKAGNVRALERLLEAGADINGKCDGFSALELATIHRKHEVCRLFRSRGMTLSSTQRARLLRLRQVRTSKG